MARGIITHRYLHLPVQSGAPKVQLSVRAGEHTRLFEIELASGEPDFWVFVDLGESVGQYAEVRVLGAGTVPEQIAWHDLPQSDAPFGPVPVYHEELRPQFHFTSKRGWLNDPNGLVFYDGQYHLFYQHNPYGWRWGNMHWGHAVSSDLVHWHELGDTLYPDQLGTMFSGSGAVDGNNSSGLQQGNDKPLVLLYTAAGGTSPASAGQPFTQCLAYSIDGGRSFTKYDGNPVLPHITGENRDPKVFWHEQTGKWVMALYLTGHRFGLFTSPNLKDWKPASELQIPGCSECPDLFALPVDGNQANTKWVFWGANGSYLLGDFDGTAFRPETQVLRSRQSASYYAAQTWNNLPSRERCVQIAWLQSEMPGMPFNQCMGLPCELTLRTTQEGIRLHHLPVREIERIRHRSHTWQGIPLTGEVTTFSEVRSHLLDIEIELSLGTAGELCLRVLGVAVSFHRYERQLSCNGKIEPLNPAGGRTDLRILVDRTSIEIFGNRGQAYLPVAVIPDRNQPPLALSASGGNAQARLLKIHELQGIWP